MIRLLSAPVCGRLPFRHAHTNMARHGAVIIRSTTTGILFAAVILPKRLRTCWQGLDDHAGGESLMGTRTSIALAFGAMLILTAGAAAQQPAPPPPSYGSPGVTLEQARRAAEAAEAEANKNGWKMAIAVVSNEGSLIYFGRMEDTQFGSSDVAIRKAKAAAEFRRPTKVFQDLVTGSPPALPILTLGAIAVEGGLPLFATGKIIGAIGCSGGTAAQDAQVCRAGADTIK
jgi:glc operon protein GlcG